MKGIRVLSHKRYFQKRENFLSEDEYQKYLREVKKATEQPIKSFAKHRYWSYEHPRKYSRWFYKQYIYDVDHTKCPYSDEEIHLLIYDDYDKERRRFERLKNKFVTSEEEREELERPRIPEEIRIKVWQRDEGKCARCGSREKLEYDHIVPISRGGKQYVKKY